jgi:hypothetical protein
MGEREIELRPRDPVVLQPGFNLSSQRRQSLERAEYERQQSIEGMLQCVDEAKLEAHARDQHSGRSQRFDRHYQSPASSAGFRSRNQPSLAPYQGSSSESDDVKYDDASDTEEGRQRQGHVTAQYQTGRVTFSSQQSVNNRTGLARRVGPSSLAIGWPRSTRWSRAD